MSRAEPERQDVRSLAGEAPQALSDSSNAPDTQDSGPPPGLSVADAGNSEACSADATGREAPPAPIESDQPSVSDIVSSRNGSPDVRDVAEDSALGAESATDDTAACPSVTVTVDEDRAQPVSVEVPDHSPQAAEDGKNNRPPVVEGHAKENNSLPETVNIANENGCDKNSSPVYEPVTDTSPVSLNTDSAEEDASPLVDKVVDARNQPVSVDVVDRNGSSGAAKATDSDTPALTCDDTDLSPLPLTPDSHNDSTHPLIANGSDDPTAPLIGSSGANSAASNRANSNVNNSTTSRIRSALSRVRKPPCLESARMATSLEDISSLRLWKGIVAEFVGVLLLVLVGCGSCVSLEEGGSSSVVQIALCFGLSVGTIVWNIAHISGGHINPAVTIALLATRKISLAKAIFFVLFQLVGAVVGAGILMGLTPEKYQGNLGSTLVNDNIDPGKGLGVEIFITFVLVFTVFASIDSKRRDVNGSTPLTIGLSVTMCHLFAIQYTGSSMNTARSFGPALVTGNWDHHWVYWVGPIIGGVAAGLIYEYLFAVNASLTKVRACVLSSDYDDDKFKAKKIKVRIVEEDPVGPTESLSLTDGAEKPAMEELRGLESV